jgi:tRNA pseudouridine32 synthase/23S rRNA pseudouridine746 synthase
MLNPFDDVAPHPLAQQAAEELMALLRQGLIAPSVPVSVLSREEGGKMFGVLVATDAQGQRHTLRAVSGQVERQWHLEGYAPPIFDEARRAAVEVPAESVVKALTARVEEARRDPRLLAARAAVVVLETEAAQGRAELRARHRLQQQQRQLEREATSDAGELFALAQRSRADDHERRKFDASARSAHAEALSKVAPLERRLAALERLRRLVSCEAVRRIWDCYLLTNFAGETTPLRALFPKGDPPSGAGDCAAPKLLEAARRAQLTPVALAEFWWGKPPRSGSRVEGMYFPACKEKCGPVLSFMMRGLCVQPRQTWKPRAVPDDELRAVYQDSRFLVFDKPAGMLSVPARDQAITDSLTARVKQRFPHATGPLAVHRLDLDTSGLMLVALDLDMYRLLQAQFLSRSVQKRYVAVLDGVLQGDAGRIELPLRVDVDQRPRQLVDFEHGKRAVTEWKVLAREHGRTRVALVPITGRTHQLRVHAAHAMGLGLPIVGDRLYGKADVRMLLHAEFLEFQHPELGTTLTVMSHAPF